MFPLSVIVTTVDAVAAVVAVSAFPDRLPVNPSVALTDPVTITGPVFISTVPQSVCVSPAASPNTFDPELTIIDEVW